MSFSDLGIEVKSNRNEQKTKCPNCIKIGKTNIQDTCLSINLNEGLYHCHKCGWSGKVKEQTTLVNMDYIKKYQLPQKPRMKQKKESNFQMLLDRGITQEVIDKNKIAISENNKFLIFPYFENGQLVNYKGRSIEDKSFIQAGNAKPIMYNYDRIKNSKVIILNEGEIDSLSWEVAGFEFHTSVNQGAPNENDKSVDKKLECITNSYDAFEQAEIVYLAVDMDSNGRRLQKELIRRIGAEKCRLIDYADCKDANEYLNTHGKEELANLLDTAKEVEVEGVFTASSVYDSLMDYYLNGETESQSTGIFEVDNVWKWRKSEVNVWTGYQNEGKTLFLLQLSLLKALNDGDRFAVFSPENMPMKDFFSDLIESYIGKPITPRYGVERMNIEEYKHAIEVINEHFYLVYPENDFKIETIFEKVKYLVRSKGVQHMIIDPYNTVEHLMRAGEREDLYISRFMAMLKRFAVDQDITMHLVAHQLTPRPNPNDGNRYFKPTLNNIKGGGTFADKADNVLFVWRPNRAVDFRCSEVIIGSQKIKKQKLVARPGDVGEVNFDIKTQRYLFDGKSPFEKFDKLINSDSEIYNEIKKIEYDNLDSIFGDFDFKPLEFDDNLPF